MPLCPADEQMSSEFTPQVTKACGVFVIMGLLTTFIRFLRTSPQETARRRGQRQPIALRFPLALLGRFRIRPVTQSTFVSWTGQQRSTSANHAARFALAFLGRFRIRPVTQSTFVSWTGQQRSTSANHAARFALAFLGRFRIRPVTQSTFVSWTGQQRGTGQGVVVFIGRNQESCFRSRRIQTVWLAA